MRTALSVQLNRSPAFINNTATDRFGFATLEAMIAGRPTSAVNLSTPATVRASTVGAAGPVDANHVLRVAFIDAANAQFYSCESTLRPTAIWAPAPCIRKARTPSPPPRACAC